VRYGIYLAVKNHNPSVDQTTRMGKHDGPSLKCGKCKVRFLQHPLIIKQIQNKKKTLKNDKKGGFLDVNY
jgi:hypothetical protein